MIPFATVLLAVTVLATPERGLESARDEVRALRADGQAKGTVVVDLAPGVYRMTKGLSLRAEDSDVVWRAARPGSVLLTGGVTLTNLTETTFNGRRVLTAEIPESAGRLEPFPDQFNTPPGPWLYQRGRPLELARWPNGEWATFTNVYATGDAKTPGTVNVELKRAESWDFARGVWFYGYWKHDWSEDALRAARYDSSSNALVMAGVHLYGLGGKTYGLARRRFYAFNVPEELDAPGEWYLDRAARRLYVMPRSGEPKDFTLAVLGEPFLKMDGVRRVRFENVGFAFSHTRASAASVRNADGVVFANCTFRGLAGGGVSISGRDSGLVGCTFEWLGAGCVSMYGGNRARLEKSGLFVESCDFGRYARFRATYAPAVQLGGCGGRIANCRIHDAPHMAIGYSGNDHVICGNEITRVLLETGDAGAIYTGRNASELGTLIAENHFHDLGTPRTQEMTSAVYFDDCDWGDDVVSNRFENLGMGVLVGGGNLHRVVGNRFENVRIGISLDDRGVKWPYWTKNTNWWRKCVMDVCVSNDVWAAAYPGLFPTLDDSPGLPWNNAFVGNAFIGCRKVRNFHPGVSAVTNRLVWTDNVVR